MISASTNFVRNIRGYLNAARLGGAGRLTRKTSSLAITPIDPIDPSFDTYPQSVASAFPSRLPASDQNLLSEVVVGNLIALQSELSLIGDDAPQAPESLSAKAARAYQRTQENFSEPESPVYFFGT